MTDRELLQQALDALEEAQSYTSCETWSPSMTKDCAEIAKKIKVRLAQPELEHMAQFKFQDYGWWRDEEGKLKLGTTPQKKEWVGLTDEEIENCFEMSMFGTCRAIEAKLKEKNT